MPDTPFIIDLKPLSEPVVKLIESVQKAVGTLWDPTRIRKKAKADADAIIEQARAEAKAALIRADGDARVRDLELRMEHRINLLELRRQRNIESIISQAAHQLPESVTDEETDEDWMIQFFNHCQDIGNEEMQKLWARLLAGEVAQPGSYSLRTLNTVRMLRQSDAAMFRLFCNYCWMGGCHYYTDQTDALLKCRGLPYATFLHMQALGLLHAEVGLVNELGPSKVILTLYHGHRHRLSNPQDRAKSLRTRALTDIGLELASLCDCESDEEYYSILVDSWEKDGIEVTVWELADVALADEGTYWSRP